MAASIVVNPSLQRSVWAVAKRVCPGLGLQLVADTAGISLGSVHASVKGERPMDLGLLQTIAELSGDPEAVLGPVLRASGGATEDDMTPAQRVRRGGEQMASFLGWAMRVLDDGEVTLDEIAECPVGPEDLRRLADLLDGQGLRAVSR